MCLIVYRPKGKKVSEEAYFNGFWDNPDGMGVAYVKDKRLVVEKSLVKKFSDAMTLIDAIGDGDLVVHFRKASPGMDVTENMCHPFYIEIGSYPLDDGKPRFFFAIAHNGKLGHRNTKEESDTYCFIQDVLKPILEHNPWFLDEQAGRSILSKAITNGGTHSHNKMAIMRYDASEDKQITYIINSDGGWNEKQAHWKDGVWFSNYSYLPPAPKLPAPHPMGNGQFGLSLVDKKSPTHYSVPDAAGWFWDFTFDVWRNKNTGATASELISREKPIYAKNRDKTGGVKGLSSGDLAELTKDDPDRLTEDEWRERFANNDEGGLNIIPLEGNINITVPRDDDVIMEGDSIKKPLDKAGRKILNRAVTEFNKSVWGAKTNGKKNRVSHSEALAWFRSDCREILPQLKVLSDDELDRWIVDRIRRGNDIVTMLASAAGMNT